MSRPSMTLTALTSLLNSLHTHLQSQTQLLPTLHAQLGLPPSALEDELKGLEQRLMESVEHQIDARRKEVNKWTEKCEAVENDCVQYVNSLSGNVKATGSTVGELRNEPVLPKRYEMVSEYQEKLRQLYHTKLEQLSTLTNRITALSRTLGPDFYGPDVVEPPFPTTDHAAFRDVTPDRFLRLEKELVRGKGEVAKRLTQLSTTFVDIDWLHAELGIMPPSLEDLTSSSPPNFLRPPRSSTSSINSGSDPFLSVSTPTPASRIKAPTPLLFRLVSEDLSEVECQRIFARFVARIDEAEEESLQESSSVPLGLENVDPTPALITWASSTRASLEDTKKRREAHIQAMYDQLEGLWRRLGVSESDMDAFVENHRGTTEDNIREYEEELDRMLELKRESMTMFVGSAREEILKLWEDLMIGEKERADFAPFTDDEHTEELLTIHEEEIKLLKEERRMKAPLLAGLKKYFEICEEEKELAAAASDQGRLLGRGPRDPGRLLREEKMRKRVSKEKPRLEQDLLASIPIWEEEAGRPFLVHGQSIMQSLMEIVSAADQENRRKPPRAGSVPPRSTTPINSSNHYVPGSAGYGKTSVVTPAVRPGSRMGSHSAPNKRQRLGESTSEAYSNRQGHTPTYDAQQRVPLGVHRGQALNGSQHHTASPSKAHGKTPTGGSSLPRLTAMPVPKVGTQHHALGHGRLPSAAVVGYGGAYHAHPSQQLRSVSSVSSQASSVYRPESNGGMIVKKASRARRESFKPRPSVDGSEMGLGIGGGRWGGFGGTVQEEDEGY